MADNVLKFRQPPKKPTEPGKPSLAVAIVVALATIAIIVLGNAYLSGLGRAG